MKSARCEWEEDVEKAARLPQMPLSLREHIDTCALCSEIAQISRWMRALAEQAGQAPASSEASLLWWRARLSGKWAKAERTKTALEWADLALATAVAAGLAAWEWPLLEGAANWLEAALSPQTWRTAYTAGGVPWLVLGTLTFAAGLILYPILAEE